MEIKISRSLLIICAILVSVFLPAHFADAATCTASAGNWNTVGTWSCGHVPLSTDAVVIPNTNNVNVTVDTAAVAASISFTTGNQNNAITISGANSLTVTGAITINVPSSTHTKKIDVAGGSLTAGSIALLGKTGSSNLTQILISTGTVTVSGNITSAGVASRIVFSDTGTLNAGGTFMSGTAGTFTASTGTVNFNGGAQSIAPFTYTFNNVILSGSGAKTTTNATINGVLSMEGTATTAGTVATYGASATLQYKGTGVQTTGTEFPATWSGSGGVIIANTSGNAVTLGGAKVVNAPLTINSNAILNTSAASNYAVTFGGNFTNNGTFTANGSAITISGTGTQSIDGFTTTGGVSMTKTGGTATLMGNVNGAGFTTNGNGGTLNLGTGLTHTFTGGWTRSNGTLNGGSSTIKFGGDANGSTGTFTAGTGTVEWNGAGAQVCASNAVIYNNLTINGGGAKSFGNAITVNGIFSLQRTATATLTGGITYGASAELEYKGSGAQTTGAEFTTPFNGSGGLDIENPSGVTLNATKSIGANPLTIGSAVANSVFNDGGYQLTATDTLNLTSGTFKLGSAGTATTWPAFGTRNISAGTTVEYAAGVAQTVSSTPSYQNLTLSGASTKTLGGATVVNGNLNISAGTLDVSASNYALSVKGNWTNAGTFTPRSGTVTFNGPDGQTINNANTWYGLAITGTTARVVSFQSAVAQTISANGSLTFTGAIGQLLSLAPVTPASAWLLNVSTTGVTQSISYVSPSYSNATGIANFNIAISANNGTNSDSGHNTNWTFVTPTTTIATGTDPSNVSIAPGASATDLDSFTLQTNTGTDTVTAATVSLSAGSSGGLLTVAITSDNGVTTYCSASNPASDTVSLTSCTVPVTTGSTQFKVRITPKTHANMPAPQGSTYTVSGTITAFTSTNSQSGSDGTSATVTIDNASPANVTSSTATAGNAQVSLSWTNPADADFHSVVVLRRASSAVTDVPAEGTAYTVGNTIGSSTVACVVASPTATCTDSGLTNGTPYNYKIFSRDTNVNYSTGVVPTGSPATPAKANQATLTVTGLPSSATYQQAGITAGTSGGSGTGAVTFSAGSSTACSIGISSGVVTITSGTGTCAITATKAADSDYNETTSAEVSITIKPIKPP